MRTKLPRTPTAPALAAAVADHLARAEPHIQAIGAEVRAELAAAGLPHAPTEIQRALHMQLPDMAASVADVLLLSVSHRADPSPEGLDAALNVALTWFAAFIRRAFEEFGPVDEVALAATQEKSQTALLAQYRALAGATGSEGYA